MTHRKFSSLSLKHQLEVILKQPTVLSAVGFSGPTLWRRVRENNFPQPVHLGGRSIGWLQSEVNAWIKARAALRDQIQSKNSEGVQS